MQVSQAGMEKGLVAKVSTYFRPRTEAIAEVNRYLKKRVVREFFNSDIKTFFVQLPFLLK